MADQRTAVAAIDRVTAPQGKRVETLTDFIRMSPSVFTGTEAPLAAEQWLTDMANLLEGANVPEADRVKMVKLRFTDVARTWWLAEEAKLPAPITWKQLSDGFYERFLPKTAKKDMEERFIALQQGGRSIDAYAAEFRRLSRFAPNLVSTEECRADKFMQGLQTEIQVLMSPHGL